VKPETIARVAVAPACPSDAEIVAAAKFVGLGAPEQSPFEQGISPLAPNPKVAVALVQVPADAVMFDGLVPVTETPVVNAGQRVVALWHVVIDHVPVNERK
jgi:hypothetical protein